MALVAPLYSTAQNAVYHNNDECTERNNIESRYLAPGTGGLRLCHHCEILNAGR